MLTGAISMAQAQSFNGEETSSFSKNSQLRNYRTHHNTSLKAMHKRRRALRQGNHAYWKKDYNTATSKYNDAATADSTYYKTIYNTGNSMYRTRSFSEAAQYYSEVLGNPDLQGKQRAFAFYNLGNCQLQLALQQRQNLRRSIHTGRMSNQTNDGGIEKLRQAISNFQECLKLNPADMKAKYNLSYARKLLAQMESSTSGKNGMSGENGQQGGQGQQDAQGRQSPDGQQANQGTQGQQGGQFGNTGRDTGKGSPDDTGQTNSGKKGSNPQDQDKGQQNQQGKTGSNGPQSNQGDNRDGKGNGTNDGDGDGGGRGHGNGEGMNPDQLRKERLEKDRKKREAEQLLNAMKNYELNTMKSQIKAHAKERGKTDKDW